MFFSPNYQKLKVEIFFVKENAYVSNVYQFIGARLSLFALSEV